MSDDLHVHLTRYLDVHVPVGTSLKRVRALVTGAMVCLSWISCESLRKASRSGTTVGRRVYILREQNNQSVLLISFGATPVRRPIRNRIKSDWVSMSPVSSCMCICDFQNRNKVRLTHSAVPLKDQKGRAGSSALTAHCELDLQWTLVHSSGVDMVER